MDTIISRCPMVTLHMQAQTKRHLYHSGAPNWSCVEVTGRSYLTLAVHVAVFLELLLITILPSAFFRVETLLPSIEVLASFRYPAFAPLGANPSKNTRKNTESLIGSVSGPSCRPESRLKILQHLDPNQQQCDFLFVWTLFRVKLLQFKMQREHVRTAEHKRWSILYAEGLV